MTFSPSPLPPAVAEEFDKLLEKWYWAVHGRGSRATEPVEEIAALYRFVAERSQPEKGARELTQERDRLWCLCLLDEDVEVIQRITTRVNERRTDNPIGLWPAIDPAGFRLSPSGEPQPTCSECRKPLDEQDAGLITICRHCWEEKVIKPCGIPAKILGVSSGGPQRPHTWSPSEEAVTRAKDVLNTGLVNETGGFAFRDRVRKALEAAADVDFGGAQQETTP